MKTIITLAFFALLGTTSFSQTAREYSNHHTTDSSLIVEVTDGTYHFSFYSEQVVQTIFIPKDQKVSQPSHAVVQPTLHEKIKIQKNSLGLTCQKADLEIRIQFEPFLLSYWYKKQLIIEESTGYSKDSVHEKISFHLTSDEALYGGGARALGMNRRGNRLELYNRAHYGYENRSELMNFTIPMVLSSKQYAIHFDNAPIGFLDLDSKKKNELTYETIGGRKVYQVIVGDSWEQLIENYTTLTGKQPLPPRWAFGNFASRFGYHSEAEARRTVALYQKEGIPLDAIILDLYWFGKDIQGTMGNLSFYTDSFPTPQKMIADFSQSKIKTILITEPFILTTSKRWTEAKELVAKDSLGQPFVYNFYFGNTGLLDIYQPKTRVWFWNIYATLHDLGVKGIWGDLGEPEVHPAGLRHVTGTANELHNRYGHDWAGLIANGYQKYYPTERPFILMRAGTSGSQRYGMIPWSGDVNRTWGGLRAQTEIALQMGMQGMAYMHSDLGGFAGSNDDSELYLRWLQYGVFQPIFRPHSQEEVPAEPVFKDEKTKALAKNAIELRYALLPYNYSLAFQNNQTGIPLMRPLFFEEPTNNNLESLEDTYLWGDAFLISPVMEKGQTSKTIYFPATANWYNWYTGEKIQGGSTAPVSIQMTSIPTFVRGGSFVPISAPILSTEDYQAHQVTIHFFYDARSSKSHFKLYEDNGLLANAFELGNAQTTNYTSICTKKTVQILIEPQIGENYRVKNGGRFFEIHNIEEAPKKVTMDNKTLVTTYNPETKRLIFQLEDNVLSHKIRIQL